MKQKNPIALSIAFGSPVPQPTEWQHIGDEIDAAMIFAGADFVNLRGGRWLPSTG